MSRRIRVVFLAQWLDERPMEGLEGRFINALRHADMDVEAVTGPPLDLRSNEVPPGYRWWRGSEETAEGVPVHRYPFYPGHSSSARDRLLLYGTFAASTTAGGQGHLRRADVALVYSSPATAALAAMVARRLSGTPYVLMVQDVWPDSIFASGFLTGRVRPIAEGATNRFVDASYRMATRVTTLSPGMRELLMSRGVPGDKIDVVYNWADEELYTSPLQVPARVDGEPLHLLYAGNLGPPQGLDLVIEAIARFAPGQVRLSLAGGGVAVPQLRALAEARPGVDVRFLGQLDPVDLVKVQQTAHMHLVSLRDEPLFRITLPSKTQALLCAGAPILAFAPGEVPQIVTEARAGLAATAGDVDALAAAIGQAMTWPSGAFAECGRSAREYYFANMSAELNAGRLVETMRRAAAEGRTRRRSRRA